ncbi:MAG TPA: sigma-70 family RNA polymerase sigma factor [Polyangiales bacterium]
MTTSSAASLITSDTIAALTPALRKAARRLAPTLEDADDLLQETWCSALKTATTFEARSSLLSWLRSIMRRRYADHCRRARWNDALDESSHAAPQALPVDQLGWSSVAGRASRALNRLTPQEQLAITLVDVEELERDEAAAQLNVSRGHLRVILHRAHLKLERSLRNQGLSLELCA